MEPIIATVTTSVAQDVRELVHAAELEEQVLIEKEPPNWRWHVPLGFVTMAAAGALLVAAGGVQQGYQQRQHGARRHTRTKLHKKKVRPQGLPLPRAAE